MTESSLKCRVASARFELYLSLLTHHKYSEDTMTTPLHWAASNGTPEELELEILAEGGTPECVNYPDGFGRSAFLRSAYSGKVGNLIICWKYGADLESTDYFGHSALHLAAKENHVEAVCYLLDLGINVNARDNYGRQPHHLAALKDAAGPLRVLLQYAAVDINEVDYWNHSALYLASFFQASKSLYVLEEFDADYAVGKWID